MLNTIIKTLSSIKLWGSGIYIGKRCNKARSRYNDIISNIQVGAIIGKHTQGYISSLFVGGKLSHVGLYLGDYKHYVHAVIHADPVEGVVIDELYDFINCDYVEVWNPREFITTLNVKNIHYVIDDIINLKYDYIFDSNNNSYYCSELIAHILKKALDINSTISYRYTKGIYDPNTFINYNKFILTYQNRFR